MIYCIRHLITVTVKNLFQEHPLKRITTKDSTFEFFNYIKRFNDLNQVRKTTLKNDFWTILNKNGKNQYGGKKKMKEENQNTVKPAYNDHP